MILLLIGFILAVVGTLPPGLINIHAMERSLDRGLFSGIMLSLGAVVVEIGQISVSYELAKNIGSLGEFATPIQLFSAVLFTGIAIYYFLKKHDDKHLNEVKVKSDFSFFMGAFLALINFLVIPYWMFYITLLRNKGLMEFNYSDFGHLLIGGVVGTLLVLIMYVYLGKILKKNMARWRKFSDYLIGVIFLALATIQIVYYFQ